MSNADNSNNSNNHSGHPNDNQNRHFWKTNSYDQPTDSRSSSRHFHKTRSCDSVSNWRDKSQRSEAETYDGRPLQRQSSFMESTTKNTREQTKYSSHSRDRYRRQHFTEKQEQRELWKQRHDEKTNEIVMDDFPELQSNKVTSEESSNKYLQKCMKTKEDDKKRNIIQLHDPKYWRGHTWIGPMFIRSTHPPLIEYSRNDTDWSPSWKDTFTEDEWNHMQRQQELEEANEVGKRLCELSERDLEEAWILYEETGEINYRLQAHFDGIEYQKYEDRLEEEWNAAASEEYNTELSDNPDAYDSDYGSDRSY